jgi:hypothetical protein
MVNQEKQANREIRVSQVIPETKELPVIKDHMEIRE